MECLITESHINIDAIISNYKYANAMLVLSFQNIMLKQLNLKMHMSRFDICISTLSD